MENGWRTVFVRVNKNMGRRRDEGYLRIPPLSFAFFCKNKNFVERTSGEVILFRADNNYIAGILQF